MIKAAILGDTSYKKWLLDLYGDEYAEYKRNVNRLIPWKPRTEKRQ
ncbi:hypothetical protein [Butyrivibrio proteoclasticus]|nr:hypothetical protein [Butyrivibrio proteoclasticus]